MKALKAYEYGVEATINAGRPHICNNETCPETGSYYVSLLRNGKVWLMAGPYQTHSESLTDVDKVQRICNDIDPWVAFLPFGTCRTEGGKPGRLNQLGKI